MKTLPSSAYSVILFLSPRNCGKEIVFGRDSFGAGVHQHEASGPVGVFRHPGFAAHLAEQSGLLVTGDPGDGEPLQGAHRRYAPYTSLELLAAGSIERGTCRALSSSSSQSRV